MALNYLEWLRHVGARNTLFASYQSDVDALLLDWGAPCIDISELVGINPDGACPLSPFPPALHLCACARTSLLEDACEQRRGGGGGTWEPLGMLLGPIEHQGARFSVERWSGRAEIATGQGTRNRRSSRPTHGAYRSWPYVSVLLWPSGGDDVRPSRPAR